MLRHEDSTLRMIRNRQKTLERWEKLRKYVMYTWGFSILDDDHDNKKNGSCCSGDILKSISGKGSSQKHRQQSRTDSKLIYSGYSCGQGWFFTPCTNDPRLRGLTNILRLHVKKVNCSEWEQITLPSSVRAIVALNLHNYGSGRHPWGNLKPDYLEKIKHAQHLTPGTADWFGRDYCFSTEFGNILS
ncbi:diacylglycerol kinase 3-like isoform X2 [Humulus lupulus]|uniref:diacylglycerol kinase 3-like isoform X2 n=1 Tax=Humulus lupulus TaxID=3486 RepID=UPI002B40DE65|nr:diacylglycerol kinase 3-like isoform X2 [Humulus lupulus]